MKYNYLLPLLTAFFTISSYSNLKAQTKLPTDSKITIGQLDNGLTYYIMPNTEPANKVELRLVVKAGSLNEDDSQQGLAHMAEHMAFNGTTHFKKNEIISFLQDIGVGFGNDLNANTHFNETIYILPIPTDKPENIEKGFMVLEDWAHNITFNNDDIDGERGIILEESRTRKDANNRMSRKYWGRLFQGSLYANRFPIGIDSIIQHFKHDEIKRFYKDWYRPDLMAVVVVGDISKEKAEQYIKKHFAGLTNPATMPVKKDPGVPAFNGTDAIVITDKEATNYSVSVDYQVFKKQPYNTEARYNEVAIRILFTMMFNQRLQEISKKQNAPFISGSGSFSPVVQGYNAFSLNSVSGDTNPTLALTAIITEVERARRFGFTQPELDRAKKNYLSVIEYYYNNRDKTASSFFVDACIEHFLNGDILTSMEMALDITKKALPNITLKDVNLMQTITNNKNRLITLRGPESNTNVTLPDSLQLIQVLEAAEKADVQPYEEEAIASNLLSKEPIPGKIVSKKVNAKLGTTELKLSNGISVTLKKTDFKNDEIYVAATHNGGKSDYDLKDKLNADKATAIVSTMGFGNFTPVDLNKILAGKNVSLNDFFVDTENGFWGFSSMKDMETMLQLLQLRVTAPRKDTALFNSFIQKQKSQSAMMSASPENLFSDTLYKTVYNNDPLAPSIIIKPDAYDQINIDRVLEIYKKHFGDMSGMQFVFVGDIEEAKITPLLEKYIASLPATGKKIAITDNKVRRKKGEINLNIYKGEEEKSHIIALYSGEAPYSEDAAIKIRLLLDIINIRIQEELREKIQGIYGGNIAGGLTRLPSKEFAIAATLPCGPEKVDTLTQALKQEIANIGTNGIDESYLNKVKQQLRELHRNTIKTNSRWGVDIIDIKARGGSVDRLINYEKYLDAITVADIQKAAATYLKGDNLVIATLMPEKYDPQKATSTRNRKNVLTKVIDTKSGDIKIDLYDNGDIDGDEVTVYFNGQVVSSKAKLTDKAVTINLKALKNATNELVMYAENLGTIPPNTALMKVYCDGQTYELRVESDEKKNGAIRFTVK